MGREQTDRMQDSLLAERIGKGDERAFEVLYERYHRRLYWMAKKYVKDPGLAEDAVQDIYVKLWRKRNGIDPSRSIRSFLFTMLKNHLLNMIRDQKKRILSVYDVGESKLPSRNTTEEQVAYREYRDLVRQGMDRLPERKREIFKLKVAGLSNAQIAEKLLISINTVKTQYYHGARFIRNYLRNHGGILFLLLFQRLL